MRWLGLVRIRGVAVWHRLIHQPNVQGVGARADIQDNVGHTRKRDHVSVGGNRRSDQHEASSPPRKPRTKDPFPAALAQASPRSTRAYQRGPGIRQSKLHGGFGTNRTYWTMSRASAIRMNPAHKPTCHYPRRCIARLIKLTPATPANPTPMTTPTRGQPLRTAQPTTPTVPHSTAEVSTIRSLPDCALDCVDHRRAERPLSRSRPARRSAGTGT